MYRTDKQFMKNPATASSRIYVGSLAKTIVGDDLEAKFRAYGKILGLALNQGFAFIQFESDHEAQTAIQKENGSILHGRKIVVKQAVAPSFSTGKNDNKNIQQKPQGPPMRNQNMPPRQGSQGPPPPQQQITPPPAPQGKPDYEPEPKLQFEPPETAMQEDIPDEEMDMGPNIRPPPPQGDFDRGKGRGRSRTRNRSGDRFEPMQSKPFTDRPGPAFYGGGGGGPPRDFIPPVDQFVPPPVDIPIGPPERNDCEIIVVARTLTEYAEFIESKLKHMGLIVDLLFPNEDVPIGRVLANISSRGCLFAILVMPQNEEHRSLTLNILHGLPQEHRNMPLEDAFILISRNFEAYMRGEKLDPENPLKMNLSDRHPPPIQMLFNLLAENRQLSTNQYDRIIKYLQERRELQREYEGIEAKKEEVDRPDNKQAAELQNRILNILNKSEEPAPPPPVSNPEPPTSTPLLKDPTVQKALDSLNLGDLFKNISG